MKFLVLFALTFVYIFALLLVTEAAPPPLPHMLTVALCGAIGASLANATWWLVERKMRRKPTP
ncbi:MAG: hypothetical protein KKD26_10125 [Alphaproteobacteria bacterium]|uniref:hypothetical protein n=1 Tax=Brevundimonas sp. TaxID=1871086 RepID=UPI0025BC177A|nr:hypothetical protein [Brevundimonas sp.]MBU4195689.1 hypothetical protein [Alphaproteobacteria bacterium]MBU4239593.1 hypothetical protein [Alphaproteobacteria bacterium]MCG2662897.1 hypothetical protein [Brevundimonas sp.]